MALAAWTQSDSRGRATGSDDLSVKVLTPGFTGRLGETNRSLTVAPAGDPSDAYVYTWLHDNNALPEGASADGPVLTFETLNFEHAGNYTCTVTSASDPGKTLQSETMHVSVIEELPIIHYQQIPVMFGLLAALILCARYMRREPA
jgi:hypothetical protein